MKPLRNEEVEVQNVKLIRIVPDSADGAHQADARSRARSAFYRRLPFLCIVVLPTLVAAIYFFAIASPRYLSEVKFVVRTPGSSVTNELASLVQGTGVMRSGDDAYIAKEYMLSRSAMEGLASEDNLMAVFAGAGYDIWWRYPSLFRSANVESMLKHYLRFVNVDYDQSSGISTLQVQAFSAEDAQRLATALLRHAEVFLNGLNTRAQKDAVQSALADVEDAKERAYKALDQITAFRNRETTVDPTKSSTGVVESISRLSLETATTNARLAELMTSTPQSPEIPTLRSRVAALQDQITKQRQLLGGNSSSLAPQIASYERLLLEQQFAERNFISALTSLEAARLDAERQRVFLESITTPDRPDYPAYPYRLVGVLATLAIAYAVWRIVSTLGKDSIGHATR